MFKNFFFLFFAVVFSLSAYGQLPPVAEPVKAELQMSGADAAIRKYKELKKTQADKFNFDESQLRDIGLLKVHEKNLSDAQKILALNAASFPKSTEAFYHLGATEYKMGDKTAALKDLKKSLSLDSKNALARDLIQAIENPKEYATYSYVCPPCMCTQHDFKFKEPVVCIECKMKLVKAPVK